ncbi:MAG: hypothetical protein WCO55_01250 [Candidatus Falkowbacteria bacterium]
MVQNKSYAAFMGTVGGLLLVNGISLIQDSRHIDSDHAAIYLGLAFIAVGVTSLFIEFGASPNPIADKNRAGLAGLAYIVGGSVMVMHAKGCNDSQQLCWGVLFITAGLLPFSKIAKSTYWFLIWVLAILLLSPDRASVIQKRIEANANNS